MNGVVPVNGPAKRGWLPKRPGVVPVNGPDRLREGDGSRRGPGWCPLTDQRAERARGNPKVPSPRKAGVKGQVKMGMFRMNGQVRMGMSGMSWQVRMGMW